MLVSISTWQLHFKNRAAYELRAESSLKHMASQPRYPLFNSCAVIEFWLFLRHFKVSLFIEVCFFQSELSE